ATASSATPTFLKGINLGGSDAVTIEGHPWLTYAQAQAAGFSVSGGNAAPSSRTSFTPAADAATQKMLSTCVWAHARITMTQTLANGTYQVYLWVAEDGASSARSFNVTLNGTKVASAIGSQPLGNWTK